MGHIKLDSSRCKSCGLCVRACVRNCLEISKKRNAAGYCYVILVQPDRCVGCGICIRTCPEPQCILPVSR